MSKQLTTRNDWQSCPTGKIGAFSARLKRQDRRPTRIVAPLILFVLSGALAVQITHASHMERERMNRIGGISCADVIAHADDYIIGKITGSMRSDMGFHLSNCPNCSKQVRGIAKRDVIGELLGSSQPTVRYKAIASRKKWCDDHQVPAQRKPVVAQKIIASVNP
jgi:hypothetical protein